MIRRYHYETACLAEYNERAYATPFTKDMALRLGQKVIYMGYVFDVVNQDQSISTMLVHPLNNTLNFRMRTNSCIRRLCEDLCLEFIEVKIDKTGYVTVGNSLATDGFYELAYGSETYAKCEISGKSVCRAAIAGLACTKSIKGDWNQ